MKRTQITTGYPPLMTSSAVASSISATSVVVDSTTPNTTTLVPSISASIPSSITMNSSIEQSIDTLKPSSIAFATTPLFQTSIIPVTTQSYEKTVSVIKSTTFEILSSLSSFTSAHVPTTLFEVILTPSLTSFFESTIPYSTLTLSTISDTNLPNITTVNRTTVPTNSTLVEILPSMPTMNLTSVPILNTSSIVANLSATPISFASVSGSINITWSMSSISASPNRTLNGTSIVNNTMYMNATSVQSETMITSAANITIIPTKPLYTTANISSTSPFFAPNDTMYMNATSVQSETMITSASNITIISTTPLYTTANISSTSPSFAPNDTLIQTLNSSWTPATTKITSYITGYPSVMTSPAAANSTSSTMRSSVTFTTLFLLYNSSIITTTSTIEANESYPSVDIASILPTPPLLSSSLGVKATTSVTSPASSKFIDLAVTETYIPSLETVVITLSQSSINPTGVSTARRVPTSSLASSLSELWTTTTALMQSTQVTSKTSGIHPSLSTNQKTPSTIATETSKILTIQPSLSSTPRPSSYYVTTVMSIPSYSTVKSLSLVVTSPASSIPHATSSIAPTSGPTTAPYAQEFKGELTILNEIYVSSLSDRESREYINLSNNIKRVFTKIYKRDVPGFSHMEIRGFQEAVNGQLLCEVTVYARFEAQVTGSQLEDVTYAATRSGRSKPYELSKVKFTDQTEPDRKIFDGTATVENRVYEEELADPESVVFRKQAMEIEAVFNDVFIAIEGFLFCRISSFRQGSVIVEFKAYTTRTSPATEKDFVLYLRNANNETLRGLVIRKDSVVVTKASSKPTEGGWDWWLIVVCAACGFFIVIITVLVVYCVRRHRKRTTLEWDPTYDNRSYDIWAEDPGLEMSGFRTTGTLRRGAPAVEINPHVSSEVIEQIDEEV
ncbi:mucin-5AC-like [Nematostella vectensis]|uniref:mucin-5AC-like n=1 Tax=Nematostella vectensis TaxID=45351 RepID=UPI0020774601|nr:mucin-5AC-like [Nematostella vectensis]